MIDVVLWALAGFVAGGVCAFIIGQQDTWQSFWMALLCLTLLNAGVTYLAMPEVFGGMSCARGMCDGQLFLLPFVGLLWSIPAFTALFKAGRLASQPPPRKDDWDERLL